MDESPQFRAARLRTAARLMLHVHPGPVGELLARELQAYAEFGHRFGTDEVLERLAVDVLAVETDDTDAPAVQAGAAGRDDDAGPDAPGAGVARPEGARPELRVVRRSTP